MAGYILSLSAWIFLYPTLDDQSNSFISFGSPKVDLDRFTIFWVIPHLLGILTATVISIPSGIIVLLGKHRAAVPSLFALIIWLLVWLSYVSVSGSVVPLAFLFLTVIVTYFTVTAMRKIGDMR